MLTVPCRLITALPTDGTRGASGPGHRTDPGGPRGVPAPAQAPILSWFPSAELWAETADRPGPEPWPSRAAVPWRHLCFQAARFSVDPWPFRTAEPFHLKGGLHGVQLPAHIHPLAGWQKSGPQMWPGFPTFQGSWGLDLWKTENQAQKVLYCN